MGVGDALGVRGGEKQPASSGIKERWTEEGGGSRLFSCLPADTELVDGLCLVDIAPGLAPGLECWKARE